MSRHSDAPLLVFDDVWVRSKQTSAHGSINRALTPQAIYQKWSNKWQRQSAIDKDLLTQHRALIQGANGTLYPGQLTVLTGTSGSGKSVLLRALAGLLPMHTGDVHLLNNATDGSPSDSIHTCLPIAWHGQVALLAQHPQLIEGSVLENLQLPYGLQAHQSRVFDSDWHVAQLASLGKPSDFLQQDAHHLSGGERQLVNTLRLLQLQPAVLLLDEPTAALDSDSSAQLVSLLVHWLQADIRRTLLWVTHDTTDIMPQAHKHWHMQAGILTEVF